MDYMHGKHLSEFAALNADQALADKIGQTLWDFYMYQMHELKAVHADPHPGNFLVNEAGQLIAIDFGCIKKVPEEFYTPYFQLAEPGAIENESFFAEKLEQLEIIKNTDTPEERVFFTELFKEMLSLFTQPFHKEVFDFSDEVFFGKIAELGEKYSKDTELRKMNGNRGSKHFLYINRTFFGLYNLLNDLGATVRINNFKAFA